ncbi:CDP-diacylglycerol--glycerol-3-phosphate 3-phosphatidyltransferase [Ruminococcus sp.]|uniref:CDP-diacylglycerol--glycerol-3-phosphate 3-phosphatidyltransferase n=1 Tax=Ruminococcus sp. TaxID=41978 RepID=UPI002E75AEA2|nr:CDP-diacylglycerol--glycerol-3-phosphate 3-phosphatidyltransferase [Ruminococcus sp.]MEE1262004.1 CDP-diacylglycerol--glycerol-3-phosphate 3-phosphatidyltransferase [Ruminococcus sp.]
MNLPNKLTLGRIILVPFFVAALLIPFPFHNIAALLLFIAASITDLLDGKIARKRNLITDFGKFADPLADKILVLSALLCFIQLGWCDCAAVIIVLLREFSVTSIRLIAAAKGEVIAANMWGKVKTVTQMVAIIAIIVFRAAYEIILMLLPASVAQDAVFSATLNQCLFWAGEVLIWISTVFAVISGVIYLVQNKHFISEK